MESPFPALEIELISSLTSEEGFQIDLNYYLKQSLSGPLSDIVTLDTETTCINDRVSLGYVQ